MDEREKIISIIRPIIKEQYLMRCKEPDGCDGCWISCSVNERAKALADALIAAGIGDVTEWKEKVECAKRILQIPTLPNGTTDLSCFEYKGERIQDIARQRDEYKHRAAVAGRALLRLCDEIMRDIWIIMYLSVGIQVRDKQKLYDYCIEQAEKELAEEG